MSDCLWTWKDKQEVIMACTVHPTERQVVKPNEKAEAVRLLREAGEWAGDAPTVPPTRAPEEAHPPAPPRGAEVVHLPSVVTKQEVTVSYDSLAGVPVNLTVKGFQSLLCREANAQQAEFMIGWCQHNRIDPFANEAHFTILDGKPSIQIAKDTWIKRMEAHPDFVGYESGILVRLSLSALRVAVLTGNADYVISSQFVSLLSAATLDPALGVPDTITVKKYGQFLDHGEELVGGWASMQKRNQAKPTLFQIPVKGWEGLKNDGSLNRFWREKGPFMIWKSAVKNCARLCFPDLLGVLTSPEFTPSDDSEGDEMPLVAVPQGAEDDGRRGKLIRELHAAGSKVPPPHGPLGHTELHAIALQWMHAESLADLSPEKLGYFVACVTTAQTDPAEGEWLRELMVPAVSPVGAMEESHAD